MEQFDATNDAVSDLRGRVAALTLAIQALIATHPNRELLRNVWQSLYPEATEAFERHSHPLIAKAFRETLGQLAASTARTTQQDLAETQASALLQAMRAAGRPDPAP